MNTIVKVTGILAILVASLYLLWFENNSYGYLRASKQEQEQQEIKQQEQEQQEIKQQEQKQETDKEKLEQEQQDAIAAKQNVTIAKEPVKYNTTTTPLSKVVKSYSHIVALGDSYTCGMGLHSSIFDYDLVLAESSTLNTTSNQLPINGNDIGAELTWLDHVYSLSAIKLGYCIRDVHTSYPAQVAKAIAESQDTDNNDNSNNNNEAGNNLIMLSCAGADTEHTVNQWKLLNDIYTNSDDMNTQDPTMAWNETLIVMTVGGNSIRTQSGLTLANLVGMCLLQDPVNCVNEQPANLDQVKNDLVEFFSQIVSTGRNATVRILGIPPIFNRPPNQDCSQQLPVLQPLGPLANDIVDFIDNVTARTIEPVLSTAVETVKLQYTDADIQYVQVSDYFVNGLCTAASPQDYLINSIDIDPETGNIAIASLHPTQLGHNAYYRALMDSL